MRWLCLSFLLVLLLAGPCSALEPVNVAITSGKDWIIADGIDQAPITVVVTDGTNKPIAGADIVIGTNTPWALRDGALKTDATGKAETLFYPTTVSGNATISVRVTVTGVTATPIDKTFLQKIDADAPYSIHILYSSQETVASRVPITAHVRDRFGNHVTSLRERKDVYFATSISGTNAFLDATGTPVKTLPVPLNEAGNASVQFVLNTQYGNNFVYILPPSPLSYSLISILGIANSKPASIVSSVNPPGDPPCLTIDNTSYFTINYYLSDEWGNPSTGQGLLISSHLGENLTSITNSEGRATITYGPKNAEGFYYISAVAKSNEEVKTSTIVRFVSGEPTDMVLTASPQTMPSRDVPTWRSASIIAKVIDQVGNPVPGEAVTFTIDDVEYKPYDMTMDPEIESGGVTVSKKKQTLANWTDGNGMAIIQFHPGAFNADRTNSPKYSAKAQGRATITATWGTVVRTIDLSFKNYPFVSVYTDARPRTVEKTGLVDVSVRLRGDGWALQPKPIDVVLCTDRSASMLYNTSINSLTGIFSQETLQDRMVNAMNAARAFVNATSPQDRIGLVTFGNPTNGWAVLHNTPGVSNASKDIERFRAGKDYDCTVGQPCNGTTQKYYLDDVAYVNTSYPGHGTNGRDYRDANGVATMATVDCPLTFNKSATIEAIGKIVPAGGTPMRPGLYQAAKLIINDTEILSGNRNDSVRAIVLLTDGKWSTGNPRGPGESFGTDLNGTASVITWAKERGIKIFTIGLGPDTNNDELAAYAQETGGQFYPASVSANLTKIYTDIAGELLKTASVDTQVALDFGTMEVNMEPKKGENVFNYVCIGPKRSTYVLLQNRTEMHYCSDADWLDYRLNFTPGTIMLDEEWMVNFTLQVLTEGNIKVLGSSSKVTFTGVEGSVDIPDTYITSIAAGQDRGPSNIQFDIYNLTWLNPSDNQVARLGWKIRYNGTASPIYEEISVAPLYSDAYQYEETLKADPNEKTGSYLLYIGDLPPGVYKVRVTGHVNDANDDFDETTITIARPSDVYQILIQ